MKKEGLSIPRICVELPTPPFLLNCSCIFLFFSHFIFFVVNKFMKIAIAVFGGD